MSLAVIWEMQTVDMSSGEGVSHMIGYAVRFAVPIIFLVAAISSLLTLFPNVFTRWLMRNRKYIGLTFAVAMFWQGLFIFIVSTLYREYYLQEIFLFRDELEGSIGYVLLAGMVVTSFQFARKKLTSSQWDLIQKSGLYVLWAYAFSVYWWNLSYAEPKVYYFIFYAMGLSAMLLRIAAWGKQQRMKRRGHDATRYRKIAGTVLIALGLISSLIAMNWQSEITGFLTKPAWSAEMVLWFPFWPFEPFLPLFLVLAGVRIKSS